MKVLLGADQYPEYINGAANFTARLGAGLASAGHTVDLLWPSASGRHHTYLDQGVRVHRLSSIALPGWPRMQVCGPRLAQREVEQILQIARPDVVHVQSHLTLGRALLRAARKKGVPVVATNHFMPENLIPHIPVIRRFPVTVSQLAWRDLERVFADADILTAPTERAVQLLAEATSLPAAIPVSCGIDLSRYGTLTTRPAVSSTAPPTVLFVGRLEHEKHVDELITAFARLPRELAARLEIVGMGSLRAQLEEQVRTLGVASSVRFAGAITDDALLQAYSRADLFVMPGTAELQSIATLEAMAAGLPIVAADAMALPHLVHDGENGRLYAPGNTHELTDRMLGLLGNPMLRQEFGRCSRQIAQQHSIISTLATFEDLYALLMARPPAAGIRIDAATAVTR